jgi:RNA polymerase sigma-70 factor (ECF subfamily)
MTDRAAWAQVPGEVSLSPSTPASAAQAAPFRSLFDAEFGYVCRALRRLGVHAADLEDVAQELFVAVHRNLGEYDSRRALRPWLFSFALRFAANYRRLARNQGHVSDCALKHVPASGDANSEARDIVLRALGLLDFDRRTVVVMHDLEGFGAPEIASQLGIPLNTVYSRLRLARADFRAAIETLQRGGDAS